MSASALPSEKYELSQQFVVITENDESPWEDVTGEIYHFPKRYRNLLKPGQPVIYYKGTQRKPEYAADRLSKDPHYFGHAIIGEVAADPKSRKEDLFCEIREYKVFKAAVPANIDGHYLERIPPSRKANYWRDGVRRIESDVYFKILSLGHEGAPKPRKIKLPSAAGEFESFVKDGEKKQRYTTYYERNPLNRKRAIEIHGLSCKACEFNFEHFYGARGKEYIHVHHIKPVSERGGAVLINPKTDLVVLCANCHAMIHRYKEETLSLAELQSLIGSKNSLTAKRVNTYVLLEDDSGNRLNVAEE